MTIWFVFNGDADGLCAAHQLRLAGHAPHHVITGVKRDIGLLARCDAQAGDAVWVADISLDANRAALERLLARGVEVTWFDHHYAGAIPVHANLRAYIDPSAGVCSALLADHFLAGRYRAWAVTAAFGDNLEESARSAARLTGQHGGAPSIAGVHAGAEPCAAGDPLAALAELGVLMNSTPMARPWPIYMWTRRSCLRASPPMPIRANFSRTTRLPKTCAPPCRPTSPLRTLRHC